MKKSQAVIQVRLNRSSWSEISPEDIEKAGQFLRVERHERIEKVITELVIYRFESDGIFGILEKEGKQCKRKRCKKGEGRRLELL
jgi:tRNA1(Val) A37 N6-methylase TrmN6